MKSRHFRLVLSLLLTTLIALSVGAPAFGEAELHKGLQPYDEPVTVTWAVQSSAVQHFFDGDTYEDNRWSRLIKEKLNIDLKVAFSADSAGDAYNNKLNAVFASGDLPDIWRTSNRTLFQQAYEADYLKELGSIFEEYATPGLMEYMTKYPDSFAGASFDGKLYAFPYMNDNFHQATYLWIRDDWLANLNAKAPTTVDEMIELAKRFTFEDPDGNGVNDTYGFALNKRLLLGNYGTLMGLAHAYGIPGYGESGIYYRGEDGKMTYAYIQPQMKEVLRIANELYAAGCIDPEFIVKDVDTMETDIANGSIGMMYHMNWGTWHPFNITFQDSGVITRPYPIPTVEGIVPKMGIESNKTGDLFMLNANSEHPEAFVKILNLYNQLVYENTDPAMFDRYWADEQYRLCPVYVGIPTELFTPEIHEALAAGNGDSLPGAVKQMYNYVVDFESGANTDPNAYGTWGQMFGGGTMGIALYDYQPQGWLVTNELADKRPESFLTGNSLLQALQTAAFTDIITGSAPVDSFDQFAQDWLSTGGQQILDDLEVLYPAA